MLYFGKNVLEIDFFKSNCVQSDSKLNVNVNFNDVM